MRRNVRLCHHGLCRGDTATQGREPHFADGLLEDVFVLFRLDEFAVINFRAIDIFVLNCLVVSNH